MSNQLGSDSGSVTRQIVALKRGDEEAERWFAERLLPRLEAMARTRLRSDSRRVFDEQDIANEVLGLLIANACQYRSFENRTDLEQIVRMLVRRKTIDAYRRYCRRCRHEVGSSHLPRPMENQPWLCPTGAHEIAVDALDSLNHLVRSMDGDTLQIRQILRLRLEGRSVSEISKVIGRGERAIYRLLGRIERKLLDNQKDFR